MTRQQSPAMGDAYRFLALACGITWALDLPLALAWATHTTPPPYAIPMMGLGACGPTLAAIVVASRRHELHGVFGRWRTNPAWIVIALLTPMALHLPATFLEIALGGHPAHWFYPPVQPERIAALVMFSFGEEFGWRGFAYPRLAQCYGAVMGSLILGLVWGIWHALMLITPDGSFDMTRGTAMMVELPLYSILFAWLFEQGNRSIAVAIALHAGAHLDNVYNSPATEIRLRVLRVVVLALVALIAARSLTAKKPAVVTEPVARRRARVSG